MRILLLVAVMLIAASPGLAQVVVDNSTTAGEGYSRGLGNVIQSQGQRNLSNSQAAINLTDARSAQIDNQVKSVNAYWEKKGVYNQHLQQQFYQIEQKRSMELQKHGLKPLTADQFDRTTGAITWPGPLKGSEYDQYRQIIDTTFKKRATSGMLTGEDYMASGSAMKNWRAKLTSEKDEYPPAILSQLLRFLLELNHNLNDSLS